MVKVIIAGSRNFTDYDTLVAKCDIVMGEFNPAQDIQIVSGRARGADQLGEQYALQRDYDLKLFPADWGTHGKSAGPIRNDQMARYANVLIAFKLGNSKGTADMIKRAKAKGLCVYVVEDGEIKRVK